MKIQSSVNTHSTAYQENKQAMQHRIAELHDILKKVSTGGSQAAQQRQRQQGKLNVQQRIQQLLDPGSPFLALSTLAGYQLDNGENIPAGGIVCGIGQIQGQQCMIIANDPSVKGGCYYPITLKKHLRAQEIALQNHLPCFYLVDSGGAYLPQQDQVFADREHFGRMFYLQAQLSAKNIPQIAVVLGSCTAGGAYIPAMADEVIMVAKQATIFLGGPPLVAAATGEIVTAEALGGSDVHCAKSGVADHYADNENHAFFMAREIAGHFNRRKKISLALQKPQNPAYPIEDILGIVSHDSKHSYNVREVIARLADGSLFNEFKARYGTTLVCGFAHVEGYPVGIIANNGILFSEAALKGTHFIQLCNKRRIPLVFLQNITGFMVGQQYEHGGIAKHGAKMVTAVATSTVPKITILIGNSYGAGNYAMCGRAYQPHFLFSWPNARIGVMGGEQAATVLSQVKQQQLARIGKSWDPNAQKKFMQQLRDTYAEQTHAFYASARLWDDGVINPLDTRKVIALSISVTLNAPVLADQYSPLYRM